MICTIRAISTLCPARSSHHHLYEFTCNNHRISGWNLVALIVLPDNWKSSQPVDSCTEAGGGGRVPLQAPALEAQPAGLTGSLYSVHTAWGVSPSSTSNLHVLNHFIFSNESLFFMSSCWLTGNSFSCHHSPPKEPKTPHF